MTCKKGFSLLEILIAIALVSVLVFVFVSLGNINMLNSKKREITSKLTADFILMDTALLNYLGVKNNYPTHASNFLQDSNFVPNFLMPPTAPDGFDTTYGLNGYLMFSNSQGYYIITKVVVSNSNDIKYQAIKEMSQSKSLSNKVFYNTTYPSVINMADPVTTTTIYVTYWILRS